LSNRKLDKGVMNQAVGVVEKFQGRLENRFIEDYQINLAIEKYKAYDLVISFGSSFVHEMVNYYFEVQETPSWNNFIKNSNKIRRALLEREQDIQTRKLLAKQAREWLNK